MFSNIIRPALSRLPQQRKSAISEVSKWKNIQYKTYHSENTSLAQNFSFQQGKSHKNFHFSLKAAFVGGLMFCAIKSQLQEAECQTFVLDVDEEKMREKLKDLKIKLYQYQTCPFCSKVRSFLEANKIPFEIVEVHPITKKEMKFSDYKKVPVVMAEQGGQTYQVNDSSMIISAISVYLLDSSGRSFSQVLDAYSSEQVGDSTVALSKYYLDIDDDALTDEQKSDIEIESKWREWADAHLVHMISPNVYRSMQESYASFKHHTKYGKYNNVLERWLALYGGTVSMYLVSKILRKKYCNNPDVRVDLFEAIDQWMAAIPDKNKFLCGDKPNLADISVYGVVSVMEELPIWREVLENTEIESWYNRMKSIVEQGRENEATSS